MKEELKEIYAAICCALLLLMLLMGIFIHVEVRYAANQIEQAVEDAKIKGVEANIRNLTNDLRLADNVLILAKRESARSRHEAAEAHRLRVQRAIERVGR